VFHSHPFTAGLSVLRARDGNSSSGGSGILAVFPLEGFGAPLYQQLASILRGMIERGELEPGQPLPSESTLQEEHDLSRGNVRMAIRTLRDEGLVIHPVWPGNLRRATAVRPLTAGFRRG
jgi:hypothetical protein